MREFINLLPLLLLQLGHISLGFSQGVFSPIDPRYVKLDTSSSCIKGEIGLIINGPLTGPDGLPIGGYVSNGIQQKPWINPSEQEGYFAEENGVFGRTILGQMVLIPFEELKKMDFIQFEWAFQNGKMLVLDGKNIQQPGGKPAMYSAIGIRVDGSLAVFLTTHEPRTLYEMADEIINFHASCPNAILLDYESGYNTLSKFIGGKGLYPGKMNLQFKGYAYGMGKLLNSE